MFGVSKCGGHVAATSPAQTETTVTNGPGRATGVLGNYGDAVNSIGRSTYSDIYAGDRENPDGSVTVYVGPGSDSALLASLRHMSAEGIAGLPPSGAFPTLHVVRVPLSVSELERQAQTLEDARPTLAAEGYQISAVTPRPERGEVDVRFHSVPAGVTMAAATRHIDATVAPNVVVTSINATYATFG